jgi:hypothetical protein
MPPRASTFPFSRHSDLFPAGVLPASIHRDKLHRTSRRSSVLTTIGPAIISNSPLPMRLRNPLSTSPGLRSLPFPPHFLLNCARLHALWLKSSSLPFTTSPLEFRLPCPASSRILDLDRHATRSLGESARLPVLSVVLSLSSASAICISGDDPQPHATPSLIQPREEVLMEMTAEDGNRGRDCAILRWCDGRGSLVMGGIGARWHPGGGGRITRGTARSCERAG